MRIVDGDAIANSINARKYRYVGLAQYFDGMEEAECIVRSAAPVDAVPVVRCKDCKRREAGLPPCAYFQDSGYCSFGEREGERR